MHPRKFSYVERRWPLLANDTLVAEVTKLYFERRRAQVRLLLDEHLDVEARVKQELKVAELTAYLDDATGGWFSSKLKKSRPVIEKLRSRMRWTPCAAHGMHRYQLREPIDMTGAGHRDNEPQFRLEINLQPSWSLGFPSPLSPSGRKTSVHSSSHNTVQTRCQWRP